MKVSDLEPDRTVYRTAARNGGGSRNRPVHLDEDCNSLQKARSVYKWRAGNCHYDLDVCQLCSGEYEPHSNCDRSYYDAAVNADL